jgi:FAD/FMN-containing dehydrogenase
MASNPNAKITSPSAPTWQNWSGNLVHKPAPDGGKYYFAPTNLTELKSVLAQVSKVRGAIIRVSGQRHSQPPLVAEDNRAAVPQTTKTYLVDMSCYADLPHDQRIALGPEKNQVTVNTGVREDELDAFLIEHNLMLKTVTAGGFFSLGGMTAVDVHGATQDAPIFAETVSAFNILLADGTVTTIDGKSSPVDGWSPLQFARVSLGGLGVVTSVTIDVVERPWKTTLQGGTEELRLTDKPSFVAKFKTLLRNHTRVETFFTPYAAAWWPNPNFLALFWDVVADPSKKIPNTPPDSPPDNACVLAGKEKYGAPYLTGIAQFGAESALQSQYFDSSILSPPPLIFGGAAEITAIATFQVIKPEVAAANEKHSDLWLTGAVRVIFMSYYIPLPGLDDQGLGKAWDGLDVVSEIVTRDGSFHIAAPMEFRFVKGGNSAMSGTFTEDPEHTWFVNLDLIGFVEADQMASAYPAKLLQFFAEVERKWVEKGGFPDNEGGFPHNGKMYGFYDPTDKDPHSYSKTGPFNPNFLAKLRKLRGARLEAFSAYRKRLDPNGLFYNEFLRNLLEL